MVTTEMSIALATFLCGCTGFDPDSVGEELHKLIPGIEIPSDPTESTATLITLSKPRSQPEFSALAINVTRGGITGSELTEALRQAFPNAKVGDRHGPHYLCKARTGKLPGTEYRPDFSRRSSQKKKMTPAQAQAEIARLQKILLESSEDND